MVCKLSVESESHSVVSDSLQPHGLYGPWNSPGQNTGVRSLSLLQGIFPAQGSNPGLLHCRWILYQLNHKGSPRILEWVAYPFSSGSSQPRNQTRVSCIAGRFFTSWTVREALDVVWISTIRNVRLLSLHCRKNEKSSWTEELASEVENLKIFINHTQCFQQHAEFYPAPAQALRLPRVRALTSTPSSRKAVISLNSWHNWWEIILHIYGAVMCGLNLELVFFFSNKLLRSVPKTSDLLSCKNKHVFLEVTPRF